DRRERALVGHITAAHALNHAYILIIPLFLTTWIEEFNSDLFVMGIVAAIAYALYGGGSVPFGYLADRVGSKPLISIYLAGAVAALVLVALAQTLVQLTLALALLGLFLSPHHPAGTALITREVRQQGRGFGYHGMGGSLGVALGPLIAAVLLLSLDWRAIFGLFALPALVVLVAMVFFAPSEEAPRGATNWAEMKGVFLTRGFLLVFLVYVFAGIAYWGALTFLPAYLDSLGLSALSVSGRELTAGLYLFPAVLALGAAGQVAGGFFADRPKVEVALSAASGLVAVLLLLLALPSAPAVVGIAFVFGFLLFALEPLQNVLVARQAPPNLRGLAYGLVFLSVFGIGAAGAALGGYIGEVAGLAQIFPSLAIFMVASGVAALLLVRVRLRRRVSA
ncbi:MAG: MFS transporter, partial [Thermoplasmata archaeon]